MSNEALKRACERAGGQKRLAELIGTRQSLVWYWLNGAKKGITPEFVLAIERETGVSRSELRPDLWPADCEARS